MISSVYSRSVKERSNLLVSIACWNISICWLPIHFWFAAILRLFSIVCQDPSKSKPTPLKVSGCMKDGWGLASMWS